MELVNDKDTAHSILTSGPSSEAEPVLAISTLLQSLESSQT
jgi:hypothetical protein